MGCEERQSARTWRQKGVCCSAESRSTTVRRGAKASEGEAASGEAAASDEGSHGGP